MRTLIIAAYVGQLPSLMPLWLRSARYNPSIEFLVVTDCEAPFQIPNNVRFKRMSLAEMRTTFDDIVGFQTALTTPYKLNDFKPMFWGLADDLALYEYWGYCDLDVIFGQLQPFFSERLGKYDMLLSEGHLRLMRNDKRTREAWREIATPRSWQDILIDEENFGMDEHHGINRIFGSGDRTWYSDPSQIADIDPGTRQFRRISEFSNYMTQGFYWMDGRIFHEWYCRGQRFEQELLYVHLQKRRLRIDPKCESARAFNIDPSGLVPRHADDGSRERISARNPWYFPNPSEWRIFLREPYRRLSGRERYFPLIDRS